MLFNIAYVIFVCQGVRAIYFQVNANNQNPYAIYMALAWAGLGWLAWAGLAGLGLLIVEYRLKIRDHRLKIRD